jgi:SAM-dependent methyltransferase
MPRPRYTPRFYRDVAASARSSAEGVVPLVLDLVDPRSVVDVGCGTGAWLEVFREHGVEDVVGVDGESVPPGALEIPADRFLVADLAQPLRLGRRFELVLSLEVAEHLPHAAARDFVESLTSLGPVVLFSAAVPGQGGTRHLNEQWQDYWAELFTERGYVPVDALRRHLWSRSDVDFWYAQNMLLYTAGDALNRLPRLRAEHELMGTGQLSLVHPDLYRKRVLLRSPVPLFVNLFRSIQRARRLPRGYPRA